MTVIVSLADTDAAQRLFFGNASRWYQSLFEEFLANKVMPLRELLKEAWGLPIVDYHVSFRAQLFVGDVLILKIDKVQIEEKKITVQWSAKKENDIVMTGQTVHVCVSRSEGRAIPIPIKISV